MKKLLLAGVLAAGLAAGGGSSLAWADSPVAVTTTHATFYEGTLYGPAISVSAPVPTVLITGIVIPPNPVIPGNPVIPPNPIIPTVLVIVFDN